jgi:single-stranded-DNA-specific exonuclease
LESYGGHELAAGFTIHRDRIDDFRREITRYAKEFFAQTDTRTELDVDCAVMPEVLTVAGIDSLKTLEPCGNGCPKPMLMMEKLQVERITMVGGGRHMRLRLRCGHYGFNAIYFSATPQTASVEPGDLVDVAFQPHVNEFRGERSVQMNVQDIRPHCQVPCDPDTAAYRALCRGTISTEQAAALLPDRATLGMVWRYLTAAPQPIQESPVCLCRKIVRWSGQRLDTARLLTCLDIFADVNLLYLDRHHNFISVRLSSPEGKADLNQSQTMQRLLLAKES